MEVDTLSNVYTLNGGFSALMYMEVINMDMLFRNILLAEYMVYSSRNIIVEYHVKRSENKEFAILETAQLDNLVFTFLPSTT